MTARTEGTFLLDGLVEGPLPGDAGGERLLSEWADDMRRLGFPIDLEVSGGRYSLLAGGSAVPRSSISGSPAKVVARQLQHLAEALPADVRSGLFSTLRSSDVHAGYEVQTLYVVDRDGTVGTRERTVDTETAPAPAPIAARARGRTALLGATLVAAALFVSSFFVDYRGLLRGLWERVTPVSAQDLEVRADAFGRWFRVARVEVENRGRTAVLTLERTPDYPKSEADAIGPSGADASIASRLAATAVASGYVRCEIFARDGSFLEVRDVRVRALADSERAVAKVPLPADPRPHRLVLVP